MVSHSAIEVAKTVMEVADVAWTAVECCEHHRHHREGNGARSTCNNSESSPPSKGKESLESLRLENGLLRTILERNLDLLRDISQSSRLLQECPPDLHDRLVTVVNSPSYLNQLKWLGEISHGAASKLPFNELSESDPQSGELSINVDGDEPSLWVWVVDEMVPSNVEEKSEIDDEHYVIVNEEHVVDAVATFMAKCIMSNPKARNLTPEELQKALSNALNGMSKFEKMFNVWHAGTLIYTLSMWGLALVGLYKGRPVLKLAASGIHRTSKVVLKAL